MKVICEAYQECTNVRCDERMPHEAGEWVLECMDLIYCRSLRRRVRCIPHDPTIEQHEDYQDWLLNQKEGSNG
jgi:hypothetical protein